VLINTIEMIYTIKEYSTKVAFCHPNTVINRIKQKKLPQNHIIKSGRRGIATMIEIIHGSENCRECDNVHHAAIEFHRRKRSSKDVELAAEMAIKYDINTVKMFKILGVK